MEQAHKYHHHLVFSCIIIGIEGKMAKLESQILNNVKHVTYIDNTIFVILKSISGPI